MRSNGEADSLRVCIFTSAHDTGDSRAVHREAVSLDEAGYNVTYYTPFEGSCPVDVVSYSDAQPGSIPNIFERFRLAAKLARRLSGTDYDVYHFHDFEMLPVGVLLSFVTDATVIYDVHENVEDVLRHKPILPEPVRPYLATVASHAELALAPFVDGIVAASPDIADRFEGYDEPTVVTNYPQRRWAEETESGAKPERADDGAVQFVYCGLLSEGRGILTLIDAVERIPDEYDISLVLGGKYASDESQERIERRADETDAVELVGWLPSLEDVIDLFRESEVGVLCFHPDPNKTDAVHRSNKLFQYMAAGIPILVSDIGAWPRLIDDIQCGVAVDPERPDSIAKAMIDLADDPDRRSALGSNGLQAALKRYNWETQQEKLLDFYERLTGRQIETAEVPVPR